MPYTLWPVIKRALNCNFAGNASHQTVPSALLTLRTELKGHQPSATCVGGFPTPSLAKVLQARKVKDRVGTLFQGVKVRGRFCIRQLSVRFEVVLRPTVRSQPEAATSGYQWLADAAGHIRNLGTAGCGTATATSRHSTSTPRTSSPNRSSFKLVRTLAQAPVRAPKTSR